MKKINLARKYENQIKLILKKKEIQEVTKKTPKKRKVFHTEEFDDTNFYNIPSFMEMDKAANLNNNDKIEKLNRDATARKDATAKKKARTMLEFIEHTEINTEFTASRENPPMTEKGDYKQVNFLTLNAQSSFCWQIQAILQELVWNDTDVTFISETGLTLENMRDANIQLITERNGYLYFPSQCIEEGNKSSHVYLLHIYYHKVSRSRKIGYTSDSQRRSQLIEKFEQPRCSGSE